MEKTIILGGSGFVGKAIQEYILKEKRENLFVFAYNNHPEKINDGLEKIKTDFLNSCSTAGLSKFSKAIYIAGNSDHGLAQKNPLLDLEMNSRAFLSFMNDFRGSLVLLSSQAVYYGLQGEIYEKVDHVSTVPYGISKQAMEVYAKYFLKEKRLSKLWLFRLMYAFGQGEKDRRLVSACARSTHTKENISIFGGGKSFLNPLPSWFVAKILVSASQNLEVKNSDFMETTNLNHPDKMTVRDAVEYLNGLNSFNYKIIDSGEEWPAIFWGNTRNLSHYLKEWGAEFPDVKKELKTYFKQLIERKAK